MRNFDLRNTFLDDNGKPLHGKILFTEIQSAGASTPAKKAVYDGNGNEIANPVYLNAAGKTEQQVFLGQGKYTAWLYRYIGNGTMVSENEDEYYTLVNSIDILETFNEVELRLDETKVRCVYTIAELKTIEPTSLPDGIVMLMGYNAAGDKQPVLYKASQYGGDDGGATIKSTVSDTYWKLVDKGTAVDVRDFGVFPNAQEATDGKIASAIAYANANGKDLYFPKGNYNFVGGNLSVLGNIVVDNGVVFTGKVNTETTISCKNVEGEKGSLLAARVVINADVCRTSWISTGGKMRARDTLVIDKSVELIGDAFGTPRKCVVSAELNDRVDFSNCIVECIKKISTLSKSTFKDCNFSDKFYQDFAISDDVALNNCKLNVNEFEYANNFIKASLLNGETVIDMAGRSCSSYNFSTNESFGVTVMNGTFDSLGVYNSANDDTLTTVLNLSNCVIKQFDGDEYWSSIIMRNCDVTAFRSRTVDDSYEYSLIAKNITAENSIIRSNAQQNSIGAEDVPVSEMVLNNCSVYGKTCFVSGELVNSRIQNVVTNCPRYDDDAVSSVIVGNTFAGSGCIEISGNGASSVAFNVSNNTFNGTNTGLTLSLVNNASYKYQGNVGNCKAEALNAYTNNAITASFEEDYMKLNVPDAALPIFGVGSKTAIVKYNVMMYGEEGKVNMTSAEVAYQVSDASAFKIPSSGGKATDGAGNVMKIVFPTVALGTSTTSKVFLDVAWL